MDNRQSFQPRFGGERPLIETDGAEEQALKQRGRFHQSSWKGRLIVSLVIIVGSWLFRDEIFQELNAIFNHTNLSSLAAAAGPDFKVTTYGKTHTERTCWSATGQDAPGSCGGNPYTTTTTTFLKVQSVTHASLNVTDIVVNQKKGCLAGMTLPLKLDYGDTTAAVLLCEPLEATIVTDQGEATYTFGN